jgi:aminoglycoside phosphotransferase (APT) family kinase protein
MVAPSPLAGGAIHAGWRLDATIEGGPLAGPHTFVLRMPIAPALGDSRSLAEQAALLQLARARGCPAPEPLWRGTTADGFAHEFLLLRWVTGEADPAILSGVPSADGGVRLAAALGLELARIHAIRPPVPELDWLGVAPADPAAAALEILEAKVARLHSARPMFDRALVRMRAMAPRGRPVALAHRDYRIGNLVIDGARVAAILDWEFAGWSDPIEDYGWFTARCWRRHNPSLEAGGIGSANAFAAGYRAGGGVPPMAELLRFWQAFAHLRWGLIALEQVGRGRANGDPALLALAGRLPEIESELERLVA